MRESTNLISYKRPNRIVVECKSSRIEYDTTAENIEDKSMYLTIKLIKHRSRNVKKHHLNMYIDKVVHKDILSIATRDTLFSLI